MKIRRNFYGELHRGAERKPEGKYFVLLLEKPETGKKCKSVGLPILTGRITWQEVRLHIKKPSLKTNTLFTMAQA